MRINDLIDPEFAASLNKKASSLFSPDVDECSTNSHSCDVNAVCSNANGLTHAHVQQDSQGMDSHALVSRLSLPSFV